MVMHGKYFGSAPWDGQPLEGESTIVWGPSNANSQNKPDCVNRTVHADAGTTQAYAGICSTNHKPHDSSRTKMLMCEYVKPFVYCMSGILFSYC